MEFLSLIINPFAAFQALRDFLELGGDVLGSILITTFIMWLLIAERYWFFSFRYKEKVAQVLDVWKQRQDHTSWHALQIRQMLISQLRGDAEKFLGFIKTLVAIAPLLGLLGTVTGMVEVFDVMAIMGSGNPRAMAAGVAKATLPTMAGMVTALSGLYFSARLNARATQSVEKAADNMPLQ